MFSKRSEPFKGLIATHLWTYLVILEVGLASAGLVVAGLENLFAFRGQPKNNNTRRDCFSLKKICAREVGEKTWSNNQCTPNRPNPEKQKRGNFPTQNVKNKFKENVWLGITPPEGPSEKTFLERNSCRTSNCQCEN